jgi:hypothetical protein
LEANPKPRLFLKPTLLLLEKAYKLLYKLDYAKVFDKWSESIVKEASNVWHEMQQLIFQKKYSWFRNMDTFSKDGI